MRRLLLRALCVAACALTSLAAMARASAQTLVPASVQAVAQIDSLRAGVLDAKLDEYVEALLGEPLDVQCAEVDFIIDACDDADVRSFVARGLYDRYSRSKLMGAENVAVYIFDTRFADGRLHFGEEVDLLAARIFAEFNRQSLLGCRAPSLELYDRDGIRTTVEPGTTGRCSVLYFFDTDCGKCSVETLLLRDLLNKGNYPVDVYAVCTTSDRRKWSEYRLSCTAPRTRLWELHDDDATYDYQMKYGVIKTPRLFLVDEGGIIIGRGLSASALDRLLKERFTAPELEYGGDESMAFYDTVFSEYDFVTAEDFLSVADHIELRTLEQAHDTTLFRQMTGDLLYYATSRRGEGYKSALSRFVDSKILGRPGIWNSPDDSLKVVSLAVFMKELGAKAAIGECIPDVRLRGQLYGGIYRGRHTRSHALRNLRGEENIVLFYVAGCEDCAAEKAAVAGYLASHRRSRILLVDMTEALESDMDLLESFDLSTAPFLISYGRDGIVTRKYFTIAN